MSLIILFNLISCSVLDEKIIHFKIPELSKNISYVKNILDYYFVTENEYQLHKDSDDTLEYIDFKLLVDFSINESTKEFLNSQMLVVKIVFDEDNIYFNPVLIKEKGKVKKVERGLVNGNIKDYSTSVEAVDINSHSQASKKLERVLKSILNKFNIDKKNINILNKEEISKEMLKKITPSMLAK
jgi:hypothetical protein